MARHPSKHIIKAFAVHEGQFYPMTPRREPEDNALRYLGGAEAGAHASQDVESWHASALSLLANATEQNPHTVLHGTTGDNNGGKLIGEPWYAVFVYGEGDLWVGRFFENPAGLDVTEKKGVFVFDDTLGPVEADDRVILGSRLADRSVLLTGRSAAGTSTLSSNLGGESNVRNEW